MLIKNKSNAVQVINLKGFSKTRLFPGINKVAFSHTELEKQCKKNKALAGMLKTHLEVVETATTKEKQEAEHFISVNKKLNMES